MADDKDMELDSSSDSEILDVDQSQDGSAAESSPATGEAQARDTLDVVRDVVDAKTEVETAPPAEGEETEGIETEGRKDGEDDEFSDVPFNKHPRFQKLISQRNEFKTDADRYRNVTQFMDQNGLTPEDTAEGLICMGLMKTDPKAALERMRPTLQQLIIAAGEWLPDDLQQRVQSGEMSEAVAMELSRGRAGMQNVERRREFEEFQARRAAERQRVDDEAAASAQCVAAAEAWEEDRKAKDPQFDAKMPSIQREVAFLQRSEGVPKSPQGVRGQLKRAYDSVNAGFRPPPLARPSARPAIRPVTGGQSSGAARATAPAKGRSTMEIIDAIAG